MIFKKNILEIAANYDYFILDIWGVIHDGSHVYPGVIQHLQDLRKMGKKICFLSNAPRRAWVAAEILNKFSITPDLYDFVLTSGEATHNFLLENQKQDFSHYQTNYFYIGPKKDAGLLEDLNYKMVDDAGIANFILNTGFDHDLSTLEEKRPQLIEAIKHDLPMICVNPDLIVVKQSGEELLCAGVIAEEYKKMSGEVIYFGKPYAQVYEQVFKLFSIVDKTKVLAVGDGLETDIKGAIANKIDSALIPGGILSGTLKIKYGELPKHEAMQAVCVTNDLFPQFILAGL